MSESHDIEQIARALAACDAEEWLTLAEWEREQCRDHARRILPLISAAEATGAKSMQERAAEMMVERARLARRVMETNCELEARLFEIIANDIRALPIKEPA